MTVRVLPNNIINQIAAGEVIERPASAVKELLENAIDAKADKIEIIIKDAGKSLIQITDNGTGMTPEDLSLSVKRHATSKLPDENLTNINFLGFRGEALASIGSVARLTITSKLSNMQNAYEISVFGGEEQAIKPASLNNGTKVVIKDLFFATPARLKFLKSNIAETQQIIDVINRLAMANPHISFRLISDDKEKLKYLKSNDISRISEVLGKNFADNSLKVSTSRGDIKINGYVSLPTFNTKTSSEQYFFVNGRAVKDRYLFGCIKAAYQDLIESSAYPYIALFININPQDIDVNVHPAKAEIRFKDNNLVRGSIISSVKESLLGADYKTSTTASFDMLQRFKNFSPQSFALQDSASIKSDFISYEGMQGQEENLTEKPLGLAKTQIHKTYIISQTNDGIIITDQHAAHERITHQKLIKEYKEGKVKTQMLLIPEIIQMAENKQTALLEKTQDLAKLGLIIESFGGNSIIIREIPSLLGKVDIQVLINNIAEEILEWGKDLSFEDKINSIIATIACHSSIRAGFDMSSIEANELLRQMEQTPNSGQCSHGRPTYIKLTLNDLEKLFHRKE